MATKPNKLATNAAHAAKLDRIVIQPYKEEGEVIRNAAKRAGESLQGYILDAVRNRIKNETEEHPNKE